MMCSEKMLFQVIFISDRSMSTKDSVEYPAGKSRTEPVGVIICAAVSLSLSSFMHTCTQVYVCAGGSLCGVHFSLWCWPMPLLKVMGMAAMQLILSSAQTLLQGFRYDNVHVANFDAMTMVLLLSTIVVKAALFVYCNRFKKSEGMMAVTADHRNDVISNSTAALTALGSVHIHANWAW